MFWSMNYPHYHLALMPATFYRYVSNDVHSQRYNLRLHLVNWRIYNSSQICIIYIWTSILYYILYINALSPATSSSAYDGGYIAARSTHKSLQVLFVRLGQSKTHLCIWQSLCIREIYLVPWDKHIVYFPSIARNVWHWAHGLQRATGAQQTGRSASATYGIIIVIWCV